MAQPPYSKHKYSRGFTIIEVLVASFILIVGIVAVAGLIGGTLGNTSRSGYMNQAATLATEKLEDLNRFPISDPDIAAGGSLTSDTVPNGNDIPYYDEVFFSPSDGAMEETFGVATNGATQYQTMTYQPSGQMTTSSASATGPSTAGQVAYKRRWLIEQDQPVAGVRRVTVLVTLENTELQPPVTFQLSMVRP